MRWDELDELVPFGRMGEFYTERLPVADNAAWSVLLLMPGKHQSETTPPGGDFVVRVSSRSAKWDEKAFTHGDLFADLDAKRRFHPDWVEAGLAPALVRVVAEGADTEEGLARPPDGLPGLPPAAFLVAAQALALAEGRRYARFESQGGGRYLPTRFSIGIMFGSWSGEDATRVQRRGLRGLKELRNHHGREPEFEAVLRRKLEAQGVVRREDARSSSVSIEPPARDHAASQPQTTRNLRRRSNRELAAAVRQAGFEPDGETWIIAKQMREADQTVSAEALRQALKN